MSWELVSIKSVSTVTTGKTPSKKIERYYGGDIPFISPSELGDQQYVLKPKQTLTQSGAAQTKLVPKNSVLVCCIGSLGKLAIADGDLATNQQINSVTFDEDKVFPKFGYYALGRLKPVLESIAPATTVAIVNKSKFEELTIPIPPLGEQKRIAAILDKADAIRRKRQEAIQLADEFLKSVFLDMFGDPVANPKGWTEKPWTEVLKIINGKNQKAVISDDGQYPIMGSGGEIGRATEYLCPENSVIIGRKGNINKPILSKEKFWNVDTAFGLVPDKSLLSFNYLYWFCLLFNFEKLNKTVTIPSLTKSDLLEIKIPTPDIEIQQSFDLIVNNVSETNHKLLASEKYCLNVFNSLCQKAFCGEL